MINKIVDLFFEWSIEGYIQVSLSNVCVERDGVHFHAKKRYFSNTDTQQLTWRKLWPRWNLESLWELDGCGGVLYPSA